MDIGEKTKTPLFATIIAVFAVLTTISPVIYGVAQTATKAESKNQEQDDRLDRHRETILKVQDSILDVQKSQSKMEVQIQFLYDRERSRKE